MRQPWLTSELSWWSTPTTKNPPYNVYIIYIFQARLNMRDYEAALVDFRAVLVVDPNNKAAKNQVVMTAQKIKKQNDSEKKLYSNIFKQMGQAESKVSFGFHYFFSTNSRFFFGQINLPRSGGLTLDKSFYTCTALFVCCKFYHLGPL